MECFRFNNRMGVGRKTVTLMIAMFAVLLAVCFAGQAYAQGSGAIKDPERTRYYELFKGKRVVFVPVFMGLDLTEAWSKIMGLQAKRLGYEYEVRNANFDTSAGVQILTQLLNEDPKPDVVVVHNPDVTSYAKIIKKLEDAGVYVVQLNMKSLAMSTGFAGGDATVIGEMQAQSVVKHCGADTSRKVLILNGPTTAPWTVYLQTGYNNVFEKNPDINIVARQSVGNYESSKAKSITEVTLKQHPDLCAIIGVWDVPDLGTASAIAQEGKTGQVFLSTNGGFSDFACKAIQEGKFDNYISFNVPGQGRDVNNLIQMALQAPDEPGKLKVALYSPLREVTKATMDASACWSLDTVHQ
ncbi:sugar ABC transporter substrate-binding protein [Pollutimonas harenae]|uniref:Sugar ABC transporter substrate-binding protein n=1 Tax=Pollutimonas harenae TaxID=657015 RepID=A0A853H4H5_9BURK|nr:sugar ABC transporter substrate-binding protein [Pollutimonas harenae]NYT86930.1 sugar ABC transporter substrate-binding protein [Pollutimonas harenae]TEA69358.1 sugar ABC transporter substrate-binding protein [Pollutimonas harenae]